MRREGTRPARLALACAAGALGVLLWQLTLATVSEDEEDIASPLSAAPPPAPALHPARPLPRAARMEVSASALVTPVPTWMRTVSGQAPSPGMSTTVSASLPPASASMTSASVPPASAELAPDGLPLAAMRCRLTEGGMDCGVCRVDGDCPAGQGCVANRQTRRFECMASECSEDAHCQQGTLCRAVTLGNTGSVTRRCTPEGTQGEGEACDSLPVSPAHSCHEGLRCVAQTCTLPCSLDGREGCAPGFMCTEGLNGPGCVADCRRLGCSEGQSCSQVREEDYRCVEKLEGDCFKTPCAAGERCNLRMSREKKAVLWCAQTCNPLFADACPPGEVCGVGSPTASTCFRQCDPRQLDACGPGWICGTVTEDLSVFGCTPDP